MRANGDLLLRMGINLGDIIVEPDGDIYGDGVNVAARLEQLVGGIDRLRAVWVFHGDL
jgi:adenylate cyclase